MALLRIIIARRALSDLDDIWTYLAAEATPEIARRVVAEILDAVDALAEMPGMGHTHADIPSRYRFWRVFRFLVIYRFDTRTLRVNRVIHGSRDLRRIFRG